MNRWVIDQAPKGGWCLFDADSPDPDQPDEDGIIKPSKVFSERHDLLMYLDRELAKAEGDTAETSISIVANDEAPPTGGTFRKIARRYSPFTGSRRVKAA